ncbi:S-adenosyl-L-methionine-dependent methyltransferase [Pyronema domesticum]|nr:S-adenosyl-L-methionine-dependent methyltransferase [Pyronema domesticum]
MIEVDSTVLENPSDEDYESAGYDTSTTSLSSSVFQYVFENGRRYHSYYGTDKYNMPTDEKEQDRLDLHHELLRLVWDEKLHEAPLEKPHRILDVGCGTGIWAIDMADKYPMAEIIGTDLSPIQPNWVPTNCVFQVDDAMMDWTFPDNYFDFIHCRNMASGVSNWDHLISEMLRCTAPGGYVELCEGEIKFNCDDGTMAEDNPLKVFVDTLKESMVKSGRIPPDMPFLKRLLEKAGFEDITTFKANEPVGPWPKDPRLKKIGAMQMLHSETLFESYEMAAFTRALDMDVKKAQELCDAGRAANLNKNYHTYSTYNRVYGRKSSGRN